MMVKVSVRVTLMNEVRYTFHEASDNATETIPHYAQMTNRPNRPQAGSGLPPALAAAEAGFGFPAAAAVAVEASAAGTADSSALAFVSTIPGKWKRKKGKRK